MEFNEVLGIRRSIRYFVSFLSRIGP